MEERKFIRLFLLVPSLLVLYFVFRIFQPFIVPLCLAVVLASLCFPGYRLLVNRLKGREAWAALLSCVLITLVIIVPCVVLVLALADQATQVYRSFQTALEQGDFERLMNVRDLPLLGPYLDLLGSYIPLERLDLPGLMVRASQQVSLFFVRYSTAILSGVAHVITSFFIMIVALFFLFRDGAGIVEEFKSYTPLSDPYLKLLEEKFQEVTSATIVGSLLTALAQGLAGGLAFLVLGLPNALLWGSMMALFSLVPLVGTAIIWVPWAAYLFLSGSPFRGTLLVVAGVLFVGMIDNVVRPLLIEGKVKMHTLLVFLSIMGGIAYFGMIGLLFGPILVSLGLTFLELYKIEYRRELRQSVEEP